MFVILQVRRSGRATNRVDYAAVVDVDSENDASSDESADSRTRRAVARPPRSRSKSNTDAVTVTTSEDSESEPASEGSPRPTVVHPTTPLKTSPLRPDKRRGAGAETDRSPRGSHGDAVGPDAGSGAAEAAYSAADVERILDFNEDRDEMLVKFSEASYREAAWVSREDLDVERRLLVRHFLKRLKDDEEFYAGLGLEEDWLEAERVLREEKKVDKRTRESVTWFLVKVNGTGVAHVDIHLKI